MLDQTDPLDAFLNAQRSEGRYFDTASFTIDSVKALQKLSSHQLPDSGLWVVKLVQAAVAAGAQSVAVTFGRKLVRVAFQPATAWQADQVLEVVLSGTLPKDRALMHLVTGIRASSSHLSESIAWSCGGAKVLLRPNACEVSEQEETADFSLQATRPSRSRSFSKTFSSPLSQLLKQTLEEYDALNDRCWVCPIPITVDGRALERGYDLPNSGQIENSPSKFLGSYTNTEKYMVTACLGVRPLHLPVTTSPLPYVIRPRAKVCAGDGPDIAKMVCSEDTFLRWSCDQPVAGALAVLAGAKESDCWIHFVLDGAVVSSHMVRSWRRELKGFMNNLLSDSPHVGVRIFLGVQVDDLDMSQFALREPRIESLAASLRSEVTALAQHILSLLNQFFYVPFSRRAFPLAGIGAGAPLAMVTLVSNGAALLPVAGVVSAVMLVNLMNYRSVVKKGLEAILEGINSALGPRD